MGATCGRPRPIWATARSDGFGQPPSGAATGVRLAYDFPERLGVNQWALSGEWTVGAGRVPCSDQDAGSVAFRFHAKGRTSACISRDASQPIPFRVLLDGEPPGRSHGVDVDEEGNGLLQDGRMYQLVRTHDAVRDRTLEITFLEPGAEAYVFTFG